MKRIRKASILVVALLIFGGVRLHFEARLSEELRVAGLIHTDLQLGTREKIDQTSWMVAMGGLRTLVATFLDLRAFTFFTQKRWGDVRDTYETMVDMAPRTRYYWESGSWHQAYNAASYYINDSQLPPLRRRELWRESIVWGREFLEKGIRNNPDDGHLWVCLGMLLIDSNKFTAFRDRQEVFQAAADAYGRAVETGSAPMYAARFRLYALARVAGREREALDLARRLFAESKKNRTPTLLVLMLVLESRLEPVDDPVERAVALFGGSTEKAYRELSRYWLRTREGYPMHGMAQVLQGLETRLLIPLEQSVLRQGRMPPAGPDNWFAPR